MKTSHQALIREFREEAGEDIEIIRPLWTVENFFREGLADLPEHHRHIITADGD
jgi:8-oxo-dGTP pyrophosphatase MutT (NUDIX family)